jgi:hypothetical protein
MHINWQGWGGPCSLFTIFGLDLGSRREDMVTLVIVDFGRLLMILLFWLIFFVSCPNQLSDLIYIPYIIG